MSSDVPDRPPVGRLLETLRVRRNVLVGLATGVALALALFAVRVFELLGPAPDRGSAPLFFGLALVLALSAAGLVAAALTAATAVRVATRADDAAEGPDDR